MGLGKKLIIAAAASFVFWLSGLIVTEAAPSTGQWTASIVCDAGTHLWNDGEGIPVVSGGTSVSGGGSHWKCLPDGERAPSLADLNRPWVTDSVVLLAAGLWGTIAFVLIFLALTAFGLLRWGSGQPARQAQFDSQPGNLGEPGARTAGETPVQVISGLGDLGALKPQVLEAAAQNPGAVVDLSSSHTAGSAADPVEGLSKLAALKQQGLLSDAEFAEAKAKILGDS